MSQFHAVKGVEAEKAFLVGVALKSGRPLLDLHDSLDELALLADTAGMQVVGQATQNLAQIDGSTFIGSGKVEEVKEMLLATGAEAVIFDDELSPRHQRELETRFGEGFKVLDRSALILDIFAQHARTSEGSMQVELAQYEYRLPRLTRMWTHLARQGGGTAGRGGTGGVGLRGPGETQLEIDRQDIRRRISKLKSDLKQVHQHRKLHRNQRDKNGVPLIALVGYTNAGKSTLLRAISGADIYVADQLFATLDPTTRQIDLESGRHALMSDTVGFIQKLPTTLIAAFRATLEEISEADLLIHVADVSHPNVVEQIETVEDTLAEIDVPPIPRILVWNKIDKYDGRLPEIESAEEYVAQVAISAANKQGIDRLLHVLEEAIATLNPLVTLLIPYQRGDLASMLHEQTTVHEQTHTEDGIRITTQMPYNLIERFQPYRVPAGR